MGVSGRSMISMSSIESLESSRGMGVVEGEGAISSTGVGAFDEVGGEAFDIRRILCVAASSLVDFEESPLDKAGDGVDVGTDESLKALGENDVAVGVTKSISSTEGLGDAFPSPFAFLGTGDNFLMRGIGEVLDEAGWVGEGRVEPSLPSIGVKLATGIKVASAIEASTSTGVSDLLAVVSEAND